MTDFDDMDFVDFLRDKVVPNIVPSTWAAYRQAVSAYISEPAYQKLLIIPARKRKGRPRKTSATRAKKLDVIDIKLLGQLVKSKGKKSSEIGALVVKALCVGVFTGMRPHEWNHAHFEGDRLIIENVKLNKCTEKIWAARQLDMSYIDQEIRNKIKTFLKEIQTSDVEFSIKRKGEFDSKVHH